MTQTTAAAPAAVSFDASGADLRGRWLVEASAGTGKTYALERIVLRLIVEEGLAVERILVVTFTTAATGELRERIRALLYKAACELAADQSGQAGEFADFFNRSRAKGFDPAERIQTALEHFDEASVLTIHGFCQKMLSEFIFTRAGAYDVEFSSNTGFEEQAVEEFTRAELPALTDEQKEKFLNWNGLSALLKKLCERGASVSPQALAGVSDLEAPVLSQVFGRFLQQAPERVRELERLHGVKSFSALLTDMYDLVESDADAAARIRSRYGAVLVDEFQDTDRVQYRIFSRLFLTDEPGAPESVFFVGDPKQAIYAFRGAELDVYIKARGDIASACAAGSSGGLATLATNYRSAPALMGAVNAFFSPKGEEGSFLTDEITYTEIGAGASAAPLMRVRDGAAFPVPVMTLMLDDGSLSGHPVADVAQAEAERMAEDIASLLDGTVYLFRGGHWRPLRAGDIAILTKRRRDADLIRSELLARGVRTLMDDRSSVFATAQAADVTAVLKAMASPTDARLFAAARTTRLIGRSVRDIRENLAAAGLDRALLKEAAERFNRFGPAAALSFIARERRLEERLLPVKGGSAMLMNYEHLAEVLQELYRELGSIGALLRAASRLKDDCENEAYTVRKPNDENVVRIVTIHASKGLEYPVVYLTRAADLKSSSDDNKSFWLPDKGADAVHVSPSSIPDDTKKVGESVTLELVRQAYVAMTRASSRLVLPLYIMANSGRYSWTSMGNAYVQALSGRTDPSCGLKDYEALLSILGESCRDMALRFEAMTVDKPELIDLERCRETLASDLPGVATDALKQCAAGNFVEIRRDGAAASGVTPVAVQTHPVSALSPVAVPAAWRRSSFSAIAAGLGAASGDEYEAEEFEGEGALVETDEEHEGSAFGRAQTEHSPEETGQTQEDPALVLARTLLRGASAGDWIHKLFERIMNAAPEDRERILDNLKPSLAASALLSRAAPEDREAVLEAGAELIAGYVRNTLTCDFFCDATLGVHTGSSAVPFVLDDLTFGKRLTEMPFLLSVTNPRVKASDVARLMTEHGFAMQTLTESALSGYLTGAIDMVFSARGRYFILDWKSNMLGTDPQDYSQEAMREEIGRKHYALQYVIYLVALKRHLIAAGLYTEDDVWEAIGGAFYVFVRGVDASVSLDENGRRTGVCFDCPRRAVDALDALLKGN